MPSILRLAEAPIPDNIDGVVWPFLGGAERKQVFSESIFSGTWQASIRDTNYCYYMIRSVIEDTGQFTFDDDSSVKVYARRNGIEKYQDIGTDLGRSNELLSSTFAKYIQFG